MANILPVFLPFAACGNVCVYCNQRAVTKTELSDEPARAAEAQIIKWKTIAPDWKELAFYGGNFGAISSSERKSLYELARKYDVKSIRYSTRPDTITDELLAEAAQYNVSVIELGVQSLDEKVLAANGRPYTPERVTDAIQNIIRVAKCGVQLMTGMYGQSFLSAVSDAALLAKSGASFARIYPTLVLENTQLAQIWRDGGYIPPELTETVAAVCAMYIHFTANGVSVIRMGLPDDMAESDVLAGARHESLGDMVKTLCAMLYADAGGKIRFAGYKGLLRKLYNNAYESADTAPDFTVAAKQLERYLVEDSKRFIEGKAFELAAELTRAPHDR